MFNPGPTLVIILFLLIPLSIPNIAADMILDNQSGSLVITQPSDDEVLFAEMRDVYVYGIYPKPLDNPGNIRIELFKGDGVSGERVRLIESRVDPINGTTPQDSIETNYSEGLDRGTHMIADLVKEPGGLYDPSNKLVVTNEYYQGLILGGVTKTFDTTYRDQNGNLLQDLTAGNYTIRVTGLSGNLSDQVVEKTITFGLTNSMFGTDRPPINLQNRLIYGKSHHLRIDRDWFPGYFLSPGNSSAGYTIPRRWNPNNAIEAVNDQEGTTIDTPAVANNSMILYNINEKSTSYGVELGAILKYGLEDSENTTFLYYDTGEPTLAYISRDTGAKENVTGVLVPFPGEKRLVCTRAEIYPFGYPQRENTIDPWNNTTVMQVHFLPSDGITLKTGESVTIYGVTKPIRSSVTETNTPKRYKIDNRIASITYQIQDEDGREVCQTSREVNLSRRLNADSQDRFNSIFEFGHEFRIPYPPGTYTLTMQGMDISGNPVSKTDNSFSITVLSP